MADSSNHLRRPPVKRTPGNLLTALTSKSYTPMNISGQPDIMTPNPGELMKKIGIALSMMLLMGVGAFAQSPPTLRIVTETPGLPSDLYYGDVKVKPLRLRPGTNQPITIDDIDFLVQQQYIDFLLRFPDQTGFKNWVASIQGGPDGNGVVQPPCPNDGFGEF